MGNGVSGDQGDLPSHGKRDVGVAFDRKQHDWSEQAKAQEVNTLVSNANSYIGAQPRGQKPIEDNVCDAYIDAASVKLSLSTEEDGAWRGTYSSAQLRNRKSSVMKDDACSDIPNRNQKSSVMKDDTQSVMYGNTRLRNRKKNEDSSLKTEESKTKGNMQVETDTGQTMYMQVEPETGQTAYIQVEPDTGQTACTLRRQKTGSVMQVETDTGQTVYTQVEPETGQTAYTLPSMTIPLPEEDRRTLLSVDRAVARQTEEETSIESSLSMLQLEDSVDKLLPEPQVYNFRSKPETEIESSEKPDSASHEQQICKEEPLAKPDMEIHGEKCPLNEENLVPNAHVITTCLRDKIVKGKRK